MSEPRVFSLRVLFVGGSESDAAAATGELARGGYTTKVRRVSTAEAMRTALQQQTWDAIIAVDSLAELSISAALEVVRTAALDVPFILMSDAASEALAVQALGAGAHDYVVKDRLWRLGLIIGRELHAAANRRAGMHAASALVHAENERRQTEMSLAESERRFQATFEHAGIGMAIVDITGRPVKVNARFREMLGYTDEQLTAMSFVDITHPDDSGTDVALFNELVGGTRDRYQIEKRYIRQDGALIWGRLTVSLVRDANGRPQNAIRMVEDITEQRQLEGQLRQAQKMEAIGRLAGGIAHDFNNLLTAILGYSDLAMRQLQPDHPVRSDLEEIRHAGRTAASLTRQLLAFSRKQVLKPQILDLGQLIAELESLLRRTIRENVKLVTELAPGLWPVSADRGQIEQVILNLTVNAGDAMPEGGSLTIQTSNVEVHPDESERFGDATPGPHVLIAVSDTGSGMDASVQSHLFEPFFTTKEAGRGTGLGLATVYGIVAQSGGFISVATEVGCGTTFRIYLPRAERPVEQAPLRPNAGQSFAGTETILLVEDQAEVRAVAREVLTRHGYTVLEASRAQEALRMIESAPFDLLLTDVVMPDMAGRDIANHAVERRPDTRVIYTSGYSDGNGDDDEHSRTHATFLQKPFTAESLLRAVRDALDTPPVRRTAFSRSPVANGP